MYELQKLGVKFYNTYLSEDYWITVLRILDICSLLSMFLLVTDRSQVNAKTGGSFVPNGSAIQSPKFRRFGCT